MEDTFSTRRNKNKVQSVFFKNNEIKEMFRHKKKQEFGENI